MKEGCAQKNLKDTTSSKFLLDFNLFCTHGAVHGLTVVFGIRSGSCVANWVLYRANVETCAYRVLLGCLVDTQGNS